VPPRPADYADGVMRPEAYARRAVAWRRAGATVVGGCCGTRPEHMRATAAALRGDDRKQKASGWACNAFLLALVAVFVQWFLVKFVYSS